MFVIKTLLDYQISDIVTVILKIASNNYNMFFKNFWKQQDHFFKA